MSATKTKAKYDKRKTNKVRRLIEKHAKPSEPFGVTFIKRTNGERRVMTCQLSTSNQPEKRSYDPNKYGLLPVFDVVKEGWRSIPLDGVLTLSIGDQFIEV